MTGRRAKIKDCHLLDVRAVAGHHAMPAALLSVFEITRASCSLFIISGRDNESQL